jgi:predicted nucleotidyltransferase
MTAVPIHLIKKHFKPEVKLAQIMNLKRPDQLQKKLKDLVLFLISKSGVSSDAFGVTGSILLDIHRQEFSDIDLTTYGLRNTLTVKKTLLIPYGEFSPIQRFENSTLEAWCNRQMHEHPLTYEDAIQVYARKWNLGMFEGTKFSIHPIKLEQEIAEKYTDIVYNPGGSIAIRAIVLDNSYCMFLPSVYEVEEVEVLDGLRTANIKEVVSYESLYGDFAEPGDSIIVKGKLEDVYNKRTECRYQRVIVGSLEGKGAEYIRLA